MNTLVLNFDDDLFKKLNEFARKNKINLVDYTKNLLLDEMLQLEDLDPETLETIKDFEARELNGTLKTLSHDEVKRILNLWPIQ